jgi:hypothetical protein
MLKNWMRDITLAIQVRSGVTAALFVWLAVAALASLTAFAFLCVAAYDWLSLQLGAIDAGLVMAGLFILIALIGLIGGAVSRQGAKQRAILERAARAQSASSWLLDPKILSAVMQAGRTLGWQRIVPVALLGILATQWVRERREHKNEDADNES